MVRIAARNTEVALASAIGQKAEKQHEEMGEVTKY